tara:strand:- start:3165 stop:4442 length:1278 start_codon:yes stop_codon:yes gene_type:complete
MANDFSKEERVAFESILEGFQDALVLSKNVGIYTTDQVMMERTNDTIWRPQPYIATSIDAAPGVDIAALYNDNTQLSVPSTISFSKTVPWTMNALELRDALQEDRLGAAAKNKLASDINVAIMNTAANQGTLVVKRDLAAAGYDDVAQADAIMNEQGVPNYDRHLALSSRDYNNMANNLSVASRSFGNEKSDSAYERSYVGMVAGFDTLKLDYANNLTAAAGGGAITIDTQAAATNYLVPAATSVATGGQINVDNRYQTVTVSSTTSVAAGDAFTIAGVDACHHITKLSTGNLKTFRVISITNGTTMVISPGIVSNQGTTDAEAQYQNCIVTPAAAAAIVWLNKNTARVNPFWHRDALELLPGRYSIPTDAGVATLRGTTDNGLELVMSKFYDINTMTTKFRCDTLFGVVNLQPEMSGIMLFGQL